MATVLSKEQGFHLSLSSICLTSFANHHYLFRVILDTFTNLTLSTDAQTQKDCFGFGELIFFKNLNTKSVWERDYS